MEDCTQVQIPFLKTLGSGFAGCDFDLFCFVFALVAAICVALQGNPFFGELFLSNLAHKVGDAKSSLGNEWIQNQTLSS